LCNTQADGKHHGWKPKNDAKIMWHAALDAIVQSRRHEHGIVRAGRHTGGDGKGDNCEIFHNDASNAFIGLSSFRAHSFKEGIGRRAGRNSISAAALINFSFEVLLLALVGGPF